MKCPLQLGIVAAALALNMAFAQAPAADPNQEQLTALLAQVRDQQTQLTANQAKIEEKLAALAEAIRQARIYASRGGK